MRAVRVTRSATPVVLLGPGWNLVTGQV